MESETSICSFFFRFHDIDAQTNNSVSDVFDDSFGSHSNHLFVRGHSKRLEQKTIHWNVCLFHQRKYEKKQTFWKKSKINSSRQIDSSFDSDNRKKNKSKAWKVFHTMNFILLFAGHFKRFGRFRCTEMNRIESIKSQRFRFYFNGRWVEKRQLTMHSSDNEFHLFSTSTAFDSSFFWLLFSLATENQSVWVHRRKTGFSTAWLIFYSNNFRYFRIQSLPSFVACRRSLVDTLLSLVASVEEFFSVSPFVLLNILRSNAWLTETQNSGNQSMCSHNNIFRLFEEPKTVAKYFCCLRWRQWSHWPHTENEFFDHLRVFFNFHLTIFHSILRFNLSFNFRCSFCSFYGSFSHVFIHFV